MPVYPDLLSDDLSRAASPARSGTPPESSGKTKGKSGKSKKKNEAAAEQASKEKAAKEIKNDEQSMRPPSEPPSPIFAPSAPLEAIVAPDSPGLTALADYPVAATTEKRTQALGLGVRSGHPAAHPASPRQFHSEDIRGAFSNAPQGDDTRFSPSTSPRVQQRTAKPPTASPLPTSPRGRPASMSAHYQQSPPPAHPPYYYGIRDSNATAIPHRSRSRKTTDRDYMALDTIATEDVTSTGDACLLIASDQSLHAYKIETEGMQPLGYIQGLSGKVVAARLLPSADRRDQLYSSRPLIALIVHGPALPAQDTTHSQHSEFDPSDPGLGAMRASVPQLQTSVEIYSLREGKHITTLYRCPPADILPGEGYPSPSGGLSIQAKGRFVTVASAVSGEVFIFEAAKPQTGQVFRCIGKTWTSLPSKKGRTWSTTAAAPEVDSPETADCTPSDIPIVSLSHRWLAVAPPVPSSKSTLYGHVDSTLLSTSPPGIKSHTSASQPPVTCELDTPLQESRLNKVTRDVTQEVLKGARWVGDQGMQAWKNYWNKPVDSIAPLEQPSNQFPPTHAEETNRVNQQPTLVSILDLEKLSESQDAKPETALQPIATFSLSDGCSYLSFSPTGLQLLTASTKGDVNFVWDLMRMQYDIPSTNRSGPLVRQVARFSRVTTANVIDVVWTEPRGDKLAILTDRGTVHVHDIPPGAFQWPPPKLKRPAHARIRSSDAATASNAGAGWLNAVSGGAQPILAAVRGNPLPAFSNFNIAAAGTGAGVKGGKLVANGFSKSVGAATETVNSLRHMGENRIHLSRNVAPGYVRWVMGAIVVLGDSGLRVHSILNNEDVRGRKRVSVIGLVLAEVPLPKLPNVRSDTAAAHWPSSPLPRAKLSKIDAQPISHAEIETSAPYQALHMDRRVTFSFYQASDDQPEDWVFGEDIPVTRIDNNHYLPPGTEQGDETQTQPAAEATLNTEASQAPSSSFFLPLPPPAASMGKKRKKKITTADAAREENDSASAIMDWAGQSS